MRAVLAHEVVLMLRDEFEKAYCERSKITVKTYRQSRVTLPCNCGDDGCEGWASVSLTDVGLLLAHLWLDLPDIPTLREMEAAEMRYALNMKAAEDWTAGKVCAVATCASLCAPFSTYCPFHSRLGPTVSAAL